MSTTMSLEAITAKLAAIMAVLCSWQRAKAPKAPNVARLIVGSDPYVAMLYVAIPESCTPWVIVKVPGAWLGAFRIDGGLLELAYKYGDLSFYRLNLWASPADTTREDGVPEPLQKKRYEVCSGPPSRHHLDVMTDVIELANRLCEAGGEPMDRPHIEFRYEQAEVRLSGRPSDPDLSRVSFSIGMA
jgi:hypothetical protein